MSRRALVTSDSGGDGGAGVDDGGRGRWLLAMAVGSFVDAAGAVLAAAPPGVDNLMAGAVVSNAALVIDDGGLGISMAQGLGCWRCLLVMAGVGYWARARRLPCRRGVFMTRAGLVIDDGGLWISTAQGLGCWRCLLVMAGVGCWHARDGCRCRRGVPDPGWFSYR